MSYIIWDLGESIIFNSKQGREAWAYIDRIKKLDPNLSFNGWIDSQTSNNHVAVLRNYDSGLGYPVDAPNYLIPQGQS